MIVYRRYADSPHHTHPAQLLQVIQVVELDAVCSSWDGHHRGGHRVAVDTNSKVVAEDVGIDGCRH